MTIGKPELAPTDADLEAGMLWADEQKSETDDDPSDCCYTRNALASAYACGMRRRQVDAENGVLTELDRLRRERAQARNAMAKAFTVEVGNEPVKVIARLTRSVADEVEVIARIDTEIAAVTRVAEAIGVLP